MKRLAVWMASALVVVPLLASAVGVQESAADLWARDEYHPMLFSRAAVEKNADATLTPAPAKSTSPSRQSVTQGSTLAPSSLVAQGFSLARGRRGTELLRNTAGRIAAPQTPDNPLTLPPGATRIVNFVKSGMKVAMCAEVSGETAPRSGAEAARPQTYVFVDEGTRISKIVVAPGGCDPAWSPDGARLAIASPQGLWVFTDNGAKGSRVVDSARARFSKPQWSPDGTMVAFVTADGGASSVQVVDASSGAQVFKSPPGATAFSWGADSKTLSIGGRTLEIKR